MEKITAIITPTWNNADYTIRCFGSIQKNTRDYKIIWVDNGSTKEDRQKVKQFLDKSGAPYELIQNEENLGFVKATNQGMKRAMELGVDYIVLQNNDTEVYAGWLDRMIGVAESDENIGLVGPITSPCNSWQSIENLRKNQAEFSDLPKYANNPKEYAQAIREKYKNKTFQSDTQLAFFSALIKRKVVDKIGFLSEEFGVGFGDDDDYCIRAMKAGWKIFLAKDVFVFHNHRTTFKTIYSQEKIDEMLADNSKIYAKKHKSFLDRSDNYKNKIIINQERISREKKDSMLISFISHSSDMGGAERSLLDLIDSLLRSNCLCHIVIPSSGLFEEELKKRAVAYSINPYSWWTIDKEKDTEALGEKIKNEATRLAAILYEVDPDIIYTNTSVISVGAVAAKILNKPHIWHIREFGEKDHNLKFILDEKGRYEYISQYSDFVIFNSQAVQNNFLQYATPKNYDYVYNNILINSSDAKNKKNYFSLGFKKLLILGNIAEGKGQLDAVRTVRELIRDKREVELIIAGKVSSMEYLKKIKNYILANEIKKYIKILPFIDNPYPLIAQADAILVCSRNEAFGRTVVEAMLMKKVVIGTNSGGIPEIIKNGTNGILYELGNIKDLAEKIKIILKDDNKINDLKEKGFELARTNFNDKCYGGKIYNIMLNLKKSDGLRDKNDANLQYLFECIISLEFDLKNKTKEVDLLKEGVLAKEKQLSQVVNSLRWKIPNFIYKKIESVLRAMHR